jgi:O-antigen ligase
MSIRVALCILFVLGFSIYAWRNWFASACAAVFLMAAMQHPDMPKNIGDIQGLNPWNFLMLNVLLAWQRNRRREGLRWDMPGYLNLMAAGYLLVILIGVGRMLMDLEPLRRSGIDGLGLSWAISECLINSIKWVLPGILLFDACRTRRRTIIALTIVLAVYFLIALQVIKHMPLSYVASSGNELSKRAAKILMKSVGYHRVNLSMMFSGASWAMLTALALVQTRRSQLLILAAAATIALGQALTGGRAGYVTWALLGTMICLLRWRRLLPVIPLTVLAVCIFIPSVRDRMFQGIANDQGPIRNETSTYEMTSGRTIAWSYVIPKIFESPLFGYGRQAMIRTGTYQKILDDYDGGETFPHPHNAYLETLLDNGFFGFFLIIPMYLVILVLAFRVLMDRTDPLYAAVGGACFSLVMALLIASMGSQSFYPREGSVGMWCAIGLMLRVYVERQRSLFTGQPLFAENSDDDEAEGSVAETESNSELPDQSAQPA